MKKMDDILNQALTPENEPDFWLIQDILSKSKEVTPMKKNTTKKYAAALASCLLALGAVSATVYAAFNYLNPDQITREWGEPTLADAFSGEDAIYINETQSYGGYDITLLGVTSGQNLTEYQYSNDSVLLADRSYVLFAIENENLEPDPYNPDFTIFPVVMGYDYETYSSMFEQASGAHSEKRGGTLYYMYECNNLELFADHDIYMCVSDDLPSLSEYSYIYNNASGTLTRNTQYEGLNALFSLPLDTAKANPSKAAKQTAAYEKRQAKLQENMSATDSPGMSGQLKEAFEFVGQITEKNIDEYATPLAEEGSVLTFFPDSQGRLDIRYDHYGNGSHFKASPKDLFADGKTEAVSYGGASDGNPNSILIEHYTLNEDGSVTLRLYTPNF